MYMYLYNFNVLWTLSASGLDFQEYETLSASITLDSKFVFKWCGML